ncbi:hypothetical protein [Variovorax paradoxus]|uniref:hypothetical protein n=1 Tax=Variovorax paradoxus TaxID=34073 RepID=UPI001D16FBB4|nr:hypothetical protein [Variovorax paradoxus]
MTSQTTLPIDALLVGPVALLPAGRSRSGIRKTATSDALWLSPTGLQGDAQADLRVHGVSRRPCTTTRASTTRAGLLRATQASC